VVLVVVLLHVLLHILVLLLLHILLHILLLLLLLVVLLFFVFLFFPFSPFFFCRLQYLCLGVLSFIYFAGMLLKVEALDTDDEDGLGVLLVILLGGVYLGFAGLVIYELYSIIQRVRRLRRLQLALAEQARVREAKERAEYERRRPFADAVDAAFDEEMKRHIIESGAIELGAIIGQGGEGVVRRAWLYTSRTNDEGLDEAVRESVLRSHRSSSEGSDLSELDGIGKGGEEAYEVAVKIVTLSQAMMSVENVQMAQAEAKVLRRLSHPHIVAFHGVAVECTSSEMRLLLVMELCSQSLKDYIDGPDAGEAEEAHSPGLAGGLGAGLGGGRSGSPQLGLVGPNAAPSAPFSAPFSSQSTLSTGRGHPRQRNAMSVGLEYQVDVGILLGVAKGMAYLHENNCTHRDLKPG
jgi:hypothetical protein